MFGFFSTCEVTTVSTFLRGGHACMFEDDIQGPEVRDNDPDTQLDHSHDLGEIHLGICFESS